MIPSKEAGSVGQKTEMRVILWALEPAEPSAEADMPLLPFLLPLGDRPFLQHVIEFLVFLGVRTFDIVLHEQADKIEALLGDGTRWGVEFRYHLLSDPVLRYGVLKTLLPPAPQGGSPALLLATADRLPLDIRPTGNHEAFYTGDAWTGWAFLPLGAISRDVLRNLPASANESDMQAALEAVIPTTESGPLLDARTLSGLLDAQNTLLSRPSPVPLLLTGSPAEPGIFLGRGVVLHPDARLTAPVFLGANCRVEAGAQIGPNAVLGENVVVDADTSVQNSLVTPGTYIGEGLELHDVVADRNRLTNVRLGASVWVSDNFLLGDLHGGGVGPALRRAVSRLLAAVLLVVFSPLLLLTVLFLRTWNVRTALCLPAPPDKEQWRTFGLLTFAPRDAPLPDGARHFLTVFLPGLFAVAGGKLRLVGVAPRSPESVENDLPPDWKALYLCSKAGLVTEAFIAHGPQAASDEAYSADAYYAAMGGSVRHDAGLLLRYAVRCFMKGRAGL